jgi:hypothetical protein
VNQSFPRSQRCERRVAALKPSAYMGTRVDGGASGATSQLTSITFTSKEAKHEKKCIQDDRVSYCNDIAFG